MRLRRLLIEQYGCFEHADLALAAQPGCISLVVAPNGAGKSVLRRAFHDLLFDIPLQSPMQFRFPYRGMRLHAEAIAADGAAFEFGWTRGARPQRVTNNPARYAALRAETSPEQLEQLFALDTAALRKGGIDLKGGTTLAGALLSGTGELGPARRVQAEIETRRAANWGAGKSKPPLNRAAADLAAAHKAARAAVQRPAFRDQQEQDLEARRGEHAAARAAQADAQAAARRLSRIALIRPHLDAQDAAHAWFAANPDAPALPADLEARLAEARAGLARAKAIFEGAATALEQAEARAANIPHDAAVAAHKADLARLPGRLGETDKTEADIVVRRAERVAVLADIASDLRDIGATVAPEHAGSLIPTAGTMAEARAAITSHAGLIKACTLGARGLDQARQRLLEAERAPAADAVAPDGLVELLAEIRADRQPIQHAAALAKAERTARVTLDTEWAKLPGWTGDAGALLALSPPLEAACERLDSARAVAAAKLRDDLATRDRLTGTLTETQAALAALHAHPLPDAAAIAAARATRDRGWRLIARRAFAADPDIAGEQAYAGDAPLPLAFERDMREADGLADRRITELGRVAEAERLSRELDTLTAERDAAAIAAQASTEAATAALAEWTHNVAPLGLRAQASMNDVRALLAARLRVVEATQALRLAEGEAQDVAARHTAWAMRLAAMLETPVEPLAVLLPLADARIKAAQDARDARTKHATELRAARTAHHIAGEAQREADHELATWQLGWTRALAALGRPPDEIPTATAAVLDRLSVLDQHYQDVVKLDRRIAAMQADLAAFAADVATLAQALDEAPGDTPAATARALIARARQGSDQDSARRQAEATLRDSRDAHANAQAALRLARLEMDAVIAATGAHDEEDAATRIAAARAYLRHAAMRDAAEAGLRQHGDGLPPDTLRAEAEAVPAEAMDAARAQADADAQAAGARAEQAAVALSDMQRVFDADAETTAALAAAGDHAAAAATFGRLLEEQLVLDLAAAMLRRAMQAVEQNAGDRGLSRISDAFGAVTADAYGVVLDEEDGSTLHAIEHRFPNERKKLDQLSEGTRDQLYLALRMVALRAHAAAATPLPFIADDILQTFDDARALAALRALVDLSATLQVVVLTHHEHLAQLADRLAPGTVTIQRL